jgi:hypothetical protein
MNAPTKVDARATAMGRVYRILVGLAQKGRATVETEKAPQLPTAEVSGETKKTEE